MSRGHWFREYYEAILVAVIFTLFARTFVVQAFKIPTGSMEDNLLVGDHLFVNKFVYAPHWQTPIHRLLPYRDIRQADIVVFKFPQDPARDFIKRAVAVGGDVVEIRAKRLMVNGQREDNPQAVHKDPNTFADTPFLPPSLRHRDHFGPVEIPADMVFCLGDNRDNSNDSRFWGSVPRHYFKGRALFIYWSFESTPEAHEWRGWGARLRQFGSTVLHFFTRTRWERTLMLIR